MITRENDVSSVVNITELVQLTNLGISVTDITWSKVRLSSDQWICVRRAPQQVQLEKKQTNKKQSKRHRTQISLTDSYDSDSDYVERLQLPSDSVDYVDNGGGVGGGGHVEKTLSTITLLNPYDNCMHSFSISGIQSAQVNPTRPIIALATVERIFLVCFKTGRILFDIEFPETVVFWSWLNACTIGLICSRQVYHIELNESDYAIQRYFERDVRLSDAQITNYEMNASGAWCALSSLVFDAENNVIIGLVQIYSMQRKQTNTIEAHCVKFANCTFNENIYDSNLLIAVKRISNSQLKLFIIELGAPNEMNTCIATKTEIINWPANILNGKYDFPTAIVCDERRGFIYIFTKYGFLSVCDLFSGTNLLERLPICPDIIFQAKFDNESRGAIVLARNGQVLSVDVNIENLIAYLQKTNRNSLTVERLKELLNIFEDQITRL